ncbi:MAG: SRPBCC domain-containing protein [Gemmatimonadota bacterium]|jgi:uncharacterized protein YndB with AHSA1/START domain
MGRDDIEIGDGAVQDATGRDWDGWKTWLDARGGPELDHRELVARIAGDGGVESRWWQQMVANGYEKLIGRRATGETREAGFQIGAQKTVSAPPDAVWRWVTSPEGVRTWLGAGAPPGLVEGESYTLDDGSTGEVRVVKEESHVRLTWHPGGWPRPSTIQLRTGGHEDPRRTVVSLHQEHIPGPAEREARRARFKEALAAIADAVQR